MMSAGGWVIVVTRRSRATTLGERLRWANDYIGRATMLPERATTEACSPATADKKALWKTTGLFCVTYGEMKRYNVIGRNSQRLLAAG
jgi:hypothetical protein